MLSLRRRGLLALLALLLAGAALASAASARTLDVGGDVGCALRDDGQVLCWGHDAFGALPVGGVADAVDLATGDAHACAIRGGGTVACWGDAPVTVDGVTGAVSLTAGDDHTCALLRDATVSCWGSDAVGQSGGGDGLGAVGVVSLDAGARMTCAVVEAGTVSCWGIPLAVVLSPPAIADASAVAAGDDHACALRRGGTVICWGANDQGQLGVGDTLPTQSWRDVRGLTGVTAIAAGGDQTCALRSDRTVACWGEGTRGQLGDGSLFSRSAPVTVAGLGDATAVTVSSTHACALKADGAAVCWGLNDHGQVGNGRVSSTSTPTAVHGIGSATAVASAWGQHRCAVVGGAGVKCWGGNDRGQVGDGSTVDRIVPATVRGLAQADAISVGEAHSCALVLEEAWCWGEGENGRLGNGSASDRTTPVAVTGLQALQLSAGNKSSCAVSVDTTVACWGARYITGDPMTVPPTQAHWEDDLTPVTVPGSRGALKVVALNNASCALFSGGTVGCWGLSDYAQFGNGWRTDDSGAIAPVSPMVRSSNGDTTPLTGVEDIARVTEHSVCARLADWTILCWGGYYADYATVVDSSGVGTYPPPAEGCVLEDSEVRCFGNGARGQLGDGFQPTGHYPLQPRASAVLGIGGGVRQPSVPRRAVTETPPPADGGGATPAPLPPPILGADPPRTATPKPFAIGSAKAGRGGRIALTLTIPRAGGVRIASTATVRGRRIAWSQTGRAAIAVRTGTRTIAITPTAAARAALQRARRTVRVTLRVTFTPKGGRAVARTTTVSVRR